MTLASIVTFFLSLIGLGISATFFIKKEQFSNNSLERFIMKLGLGLAFVPLLIVIMNTVKIPLNWKIFLALSWITPVITGFIALKKNDFKIKTPKLALEIKKSTLVSTSFIIGIILFSTILGSVYLKGSFGYPWLEDGDPWQHASGIKYVSEQQTYSQDFEWQSKTIHNHYLEPYTPAYDAFLGILDQQSPNLQWTMKFFNVLMIVLGHIFFYFFAKEFMRSEKKGFLATTLVILIPSFMSHFIWAQTLAITLFFPAFYALLKSTKEKKWIIPSVIAVSGIMLSQASNAFIFGIFFGILWLTHVFVKKNLQLSLLAGGFFGFLVSILIYYIPTIMKFTWDGFKSRSGFSAATANSGGDGGGVLYTLKDFFSSDLFGKIDNAVGFGKILFGILLISLVVILIGFIYRAIQKKNVVTEGNSWIITTLFWLIFSFIGVNGARLPISLMSYRFWVILSIPVVIIAAQGMFSTIKLIETLRRKTKTMLPTIFLGMSILVSVSFLLIIPNSQAGNNIFTKYPFALWSIIILLALEAILFFSSFSIQDKKFITIAKTALWITLILGVVISSGLPKYTVQTATWPPHAYANQAEISDYVNLRDAYENQMVFPFCNNRHFWQTHKIIGNNMLHHYWVDGVYELKQRIYNASSEEINSFLKQHDYKYLLIDGGCVAESGAEETNAQAQRLLSSGLFAIDWQGSSSIMFRVV